LRHRDPDERAKIFTLPNLLSISRLLVLPFFVLVLAHDREVPAFLLLLVMGLSDVVDGYLARRFHMVSDLGKVLDHLGDKIVTIVCVLSLFAFRTLPLWAALAISIREIIFVLGGILLARRTRTVVQSNLLGKLAGIVMFTSWILFIFRFGPVDLYVLYAALGLMFLATLTYLRGYVRAREGT
jgi:cardiolipin synthase